MEFKGKQGKLFVEGIKEDYFVHLINSNGNSVCSISTNEEQYNEALCYANLFSKAPEMLEMLQRCERTLREVYEVETTEIEQLIKQATEV
mgnify:CR=1 FL=1